MDVVFLIAALLIILAGAELFTNGIEWFGRKLDLAEGMVGSVLAAIGTALPETMIPIVAIAFAGTAGTVDEAHGVGVGAILGAPFTLATLAMFVTGVTVIARRRGSRDRLLIKPEILRKDVSYFLVAYCLAVAAAFLPHDLGLVKVGVAAVLLVIYVVYVAGHFRADPDVDASDLSPLRFHRLDRQAHAHDPATPRLRIVNAQVLGGAALILGGAVLFVDAVQHISGQMGLPPTILALVIAPIATELPESFNGVIWMRKAKDTLAMGNITGAMVFQSCIPTVIALLFAADAWTVDFSSTQSLIEFASAGIAILSTVVIFLPMFRGRPLTGRMLLIGGAFYVGYLALVGASLAGLI